MRPRNEFRTYLTLVQTAWHIVTWTKLPSFCSWHFRNACSERWLSQPMYHISLNVSIKVHFAIGLYFYWVTDEHNGKYETFINIGQLQFEHGYIYICILILNVVTYTSHNIDGRITGQLILMNVAIHQYNNGIRNRPHAWKCLSRCFQLLIEIL